MRFVPVRNMNDEDMRLADSSSMPLSLLVIEDNDLDVELLMFHSRRCGLSIPIVRAHHGEEALHMIQQAYSGTSCNSRYVALLDLNMPRMNGFELLEKICDEPWFNELPVYILTTSDQPADREMAEKFGVEDYLLKPVSGEILQRVTQDTFK